MAAFWTRTHGHRAHLLPGLRTGTSTGITSMVAALVAAFVLLCWAAGVVAAPVGALVRATASSTLPNKPVPVDTSETARFITVLAANTAGPLGIKTGKASCPAKITAKPRSATRFQCTVPYEGQLAPYIVTIDTGTAKFDVQPVMAILSTAKLVEFVRANVQSVTKVACGIGKVLVRPPRSLVTCSAKTGAGAVAVIVRVDDNKGAVTLVSAG